MIRGIHALSHRHGLLEVLHCFSKFPGLRFHSPQIVQCCRNQRMIAFVPRFEDSKRL